MTTETKTFAEHVTHLEARVGVFNEHLTAAAHETGEQLRERADRLRAAVKSGTDELGTDMHETRKLLVGRASELRAAVASDVQAARSKHDANKDRVHADRDAEVADAYAAATRTPTRSPPSRSPNVLRSMRSPCAPRPRPQPPATR